MLMPEPSSALQIGAGTIIAALISIFGLFAGIIAVLARVMLKSMSTSVSEKLQIFKLSFEDKIGSMFRERKECEDRHLREVARLELSFDKLQNEYKSLSNKWDKVFEKNTILEATQAEKVRSLFKSAEEMSESVRDLKVSIHKKVEEIMRDATDQLRRQLKDSMRIMIIEEMKNARR